MKQKISVTCDPGILVWLEDFWGDRLSRSAAIETCLQAFRQTIEAQIAATADPRIDLIRRAEAVLQATRADEVPDLEDVKGLIAGLLEEVQR